MDEDKGATHCSGQVTITAETWTSTWTSFIRFLEAYSDTKPSLLFFQQAVLNNCYAYYQNPYDTSVISFNTTVLSSFWSYVLYGWKDAW